MSYIHGCNIHIATEFILFFFRSDVYDDVARLKNHILQHGVVCQKARTRQCIINAHVILHFRENLKLRHLPQISYLYFSASFPRPPIA